MISAAPGITRGNHEVAAGLITRVFPRACCAAGPEAPLRIFPRACSTVGRENACHVPGAVTMLGRIFLGAVTVPVCTFSVGSDHGVAHLIPE